MTSTIKHNIFIGRRKMERRETMSRILSGLIMILLLVAASGCASTIDDVNRDAHSAGKTTGEVMRVPHSASEGIAEGIAGEPESNPYNR